MRATIRKRTATARGEMAWLEAGAGWPVILLHGFALNAEMWRPQLDAVPSGWRFIAPDLRGFGEGPSAAGSLTMDDYADDVCALMDALGLDNAAIGGLSMGGYVTLALFRRAPARFTAMVLADTRSEADTPQGRAARADMRARLADGGTAAVAAQMLPTQLSGAAAPDLVARVRQIIVSGEPSGLDAALVALTNRPDSTPGLSAINVPTLIVVGAADAITPPADAERMHRAIARSVLTVIPGAGHLANLEQPAAFSRALLDFLTAAL